MKKILVISLIILSIILASYVIITKTDNSMPEPLINEEKNSSNEDKSEKEEIYKLSLIATGDALIHAAVYKDAYTNSKYDFKPMLTFIKDIVKDYDLAFYNQETIFGGEDLGYSHYPRFNTPSEFGDAMIDAGFNIVALSNNHSFDKGETGVINAINYWNKTNVMWNGLNASQEDRENIQIMTKNNITYGLISYTTLTNGLKAPAGKEYLINIYSNEQASKDIEKLRSACDIVIVSIHWGVEYSQNVSQNQIDIANYLSSLGVDIIIGTHPHVLQPITKINNTVVMYSLGNFISAQLTSSQLTGALATLEITKTIKDGHTNISIDNLGVKLIYTHRNTNSKNFQVIPFTKLNYTYLKNYQEVYTTQKNIITAMDKTIQVDSLVTE